MNSVGAKLCAVVATVLVVLLAGTGTSGAAPAHSRAQITFRDIAQDPGAGIRYERIPPPLFDAVAALRERSLTEPVTLEELVNGPAPIHGFAGIAVFDYDHDSDLDIYVSNGPGTPNSLFSNQFAQTGRVSFVDVATAAGVDAFDQDGMGVCYGDIDNDRDPDLLVLGRSEANRLYANNGDGTFRFVVDSGLAGGDRSSASCAMGDVDGDGLLDVFVTNTFDFETAAPLFTEPFALNQHNQLFLNAGDQKFIDVSSSSGVEDIAALPPGLAGITWATAMVDVDLDGDIDIITTHDQGNVPPLSRGGVDRGFLHIFLNGGRGQFQSSPVLSDHSVGAWMGLSFGDFDCDRDLDFFASNAGDYVVPFLGAPYELGTLSSRPFLGNGDGTFLDIVGVSSAGASAWGWGTAVLDYDNDGDQDIVYHGGLDAGAVGYKDNPGILLENRGCNADFRAKVDLWGANHQRRLTRGVAIGDLNDDGFVDIVTSSDATVPEPIPLVPSPARYGSVLDRTNTFIPLLLPTSEGRFVWTGVEFGLGDLAVELNSANNGNGAVVIDVAGSVGLTRDAVVNHDGVGAVVSFTPAKGKQVMWPIAAGSSQISQNSLSAYFGLGRAPKGVVEVLWPGGVRNRLYGVHRGERVEIPEIPCSFTARWTRASKYLTCVNRALADLQKAGVVDGRFRARLTLSAMKAFVDARKRGA